VGVKTLLLGISSSELTCLGGSRELGELIFSFNEMVSG